MMSRTVQYIDVVQREIYSIENQGGGLSLMNRMYMATYLGRI